MSVSEIVVNVLFYVFAIASVAGALGVATSRNIVRSAFALLAVLFSAAALYAIMKADFIAGAQVLIYVGGILVLIIFAVMLTHRITDVKISNDSTPGPAAFCAVLCLLFALVVIILPVPDPGHNKWDAGRGAEEIRAGEVTLLPYLADGKTGLARGGASFEDEVVIGVKADKWPEDTLRVTVEATPASAVTRDEILKLLAAHAPDADVLKVIEERGSRPLSADDVVELKKAGASDVVIAQMQARVQRSFSSEPLAKSGPTFVRLSKLKPVKYQWRAALETGKGEQRWLTGSEFTIYKGVTEPVAWALAGPYLFAFEAVSVLLLAALVGAAFLARKEVKD